MTTEQELRCVLSDLCYQARELRVETDRLRAELDTAKEYVTLLESCTDSYYRATESEEAAAYYAAPKPGDAT